MSGARFGTPQWAWPQGGRAQLLGAALHPDLEKGRAELVAWLAEHDLDEIGFADHRLLAAISERHGKSLEGLSAYPRLKGLQRQLWTRSRMRVNAVLPVLREMQAAGIELMLLKGAARIALQPEAQRQRAHQDVDILVRPEQMQAAARILAAQQWQSHRGESALSAVARASVARAINFQLPPWGDIDLHRSVYHGRNFHPAFDAVLWERSVPAEFFGLKVRVPEAAERLAMTLAHGVWSPDTHSDWLLDAAEWLEDPALDWDYFAEITKARRIEGQVRIGLSSLGHQFGRRLPEAAARMASGSVSVVTSLIARPESDLPAWARPLRRLSRGWMRGRQDHRSDIPEPPMALALARASEGEPFARALVGAEEGFAREQVIVTSASLGGVAGVPLAPGRYELQGEIEVASPERRRRIEFELNTALENLARLRVYAAPHKGARSRFRFKLTLTLREPAPEILLSARDSRVLVHGGSRKERAKYAALPFEIRSARLTRRP